jgi:peptide/nickel transport system permease protein
VDNLIMRFVEIIGAIPYLFLLIVLTALLPRNLDPILVFYGVVIFLGAIGWGGLARTVRSQILALREVDYVQAANALGAGEGRIIGRHMLPNTASYLIVNASLAIPGFILAESGLSFIGRGIREPYSSWGLMLNDVTEGGFASFVLRPWVLIPGFFIVLAILCWNFLGDGLRDAFDPKKRR